MCEIKTNSNRYKFNYDESTQNLRLIDNTKNEPLINEKIEGSMTLTEFGEYIKKLKLQLNIQ